MDYINYCYFMQDQANERRDQDLEDQMIDQQEQQDQTEYPEYSEDGQIYDEF
jgi:hypothetical protein